MLLPDIKRFEACMETPRARGWAGPQLPGQGCTKNRPEHSPKVTDLDQRLLRAVLLLQNQAILGLQVTIDNATFMAVVYPNDKLQKRPQAMIRADRVGYTWSSQMVP